MGVIVKQKTPGPDQPYWIFIHYNGRRKTKKIGDKAEAEKIAAEIRRRLCDPSANVEWNGGEPNLESTTLGTPLFKDYVRKYMDTYVKVVCKWTTWKGYDSMFNLHILPALGNKRLHQITRPDIKKLLLGKVQQFKPATVDNIKALISGIFTQAYEDQIVQMNPALKLGKFIPKQDRRLHVRPLSKEQVLTFLQASRQHYPDYFPLFLCAFRTGMRMGELMGLAWQDIDFDANLIEVRRGFSHGRFSTPKSHKSRYVDLSDQLKRELQEHRERLLVQYRGELRVVQMPGRDKRDTAIQMVFPGPKGKPLDADNFRKRVFFRLLEIVDIPRFRFHDIRHTFASQLLMNGEPLHYVKEQLGHASITTTVDVYGHLVPGSNRNAVNRLDSPLQPALQLTPAVAG